jgi:hypothetical protein
MPNHVYNTVAVRGAEDKLTEFMTLVNERPKFYSSDDEHIFSFHSFVTPSDDVDIDVYNGVNGIVDGEEVGQESINWYKWNNANWNTKWDAYEVSLLQSISSGEIDIEFQTAWSPPVPVLEAMVTKFPDLNFEIWWEEEQGYGERLVGNKGNLVVTESWDIPDSHAETERQGKECRCSYDSDDEYWFEDCPGKERQQYVVEVITTYTFTARSQEDAVQAAQAEENGYSLPDGAELVNVEHASKYRAKE